MATLWTWWPDLMFDLCSLAHGSWDMRDQILGIEGRIECWGSQGCILPQVFYPSEPGCSHVFRKHVLPCRHPFMYAQEAIRLSPLLLLETVCVCGGGATDYYCSSWGSKQTGLDIIRKDRDCITLFTKVSGFLSKGNITKQERLGLAVYRTGRNLQCTLGRMLFLYGPFLF